jgi:hypothetical protein
MLLAPPLHYLIILYVLYRNPPISCSDYQAIPQMSFSPFARSETYNPAAKYNVRTRNKPY